jgi:hypothetical protein
VSSLISHLILYNRFSRLFEDNTKISIPYTIHVHITFCFPFRQARLRRYGFQTIYVEKREEGKE